MNHTLQVLQPFITHLLPPSRAVRLTEVTMESAKVCLQLTTTAVATGCPRCALVLGARPRPAPPDGPPLGHASGSPPAHGAEIRVPKCELPTPPFHGAGARARRRLCPQDPAAGRRLAGGRHGPRRPGGRTTRESDWTALGSGDAITAGKT